MDEDDALAAEKAIERRIHDHVGGVACDSEEEAGMSSSREYVVIDEVTESETEPSSQDTTQHHIVGQVTIESAKKEVLSMTEEEAAWDAAMRDTVESTVPKGDGSGNHNPFTGVKGVNADEIIRAINRWRHARLERLNRLVAQAAGNPSVRTALLSWLKESNEGKGSETKRDESNQRGDGEN